VHLASLEEDPVPFVCAHAAIACSQIGTAEALQLCEEIVSYREKRAEATGEALDRRIANICREARDTLRRPK
jgi:hypothetical protein